MLTNQPLFANQLCLNPEFFHNISNTMKVLFIMLPVIIVEGHGINIKCLYYMYGINMKCNIHVYLANTLMPHFFFHISNSKAKK